MKILFLIDSFSKAGAQAVAMNLINSWLEQGHIVNLVLIRDTNDEFDTTNLQEQGMVLSRVHARKISDVSAFFRLYKIVRRFKPEVSYINLFWSQIWTTALYWSGTRIIWVEHNTYLSRKRLHWVLYRAISNRIYRFIAVSDEVKEFLIAKKIKNNKINVIPNCVSINDSKAIRQFEIPKYLFVGRLNEQKDPLKAIRCFQKALIEDIVPKNSILSIIGQGPLESECRNYVIKNNLELNIKFYGFLNKNLLSDFYAESVCLLSTSIIEGFSLVRIEAFMSGCCIVTTRTAGITGLLTHPSGKSKSGIFICNSEEEIVRSLGAVIDNRNWTTSALHERKSISKIVDVEQVARNYLSI